MIPQFLAGFIASHALEDVMADRTIEPREPMTGRGDQLRTLASPRTLPTRDPITRGGGGERSIPIRAPISGRDMSGRTITDAPDPTGPTPNIVPPGGFQNLFQPPPGSQSAPTDGETIGSYADAFGAFGVLADLFRGTFGAGETDTPQPPIVVGDAGYAGTGGGGNVLMILLVLAGVGGAAWYLFIRKKREGA